MERRRVYAGLGAVVGLVLAVLAAVLLGRAWNACDVGVNGAANSGFLFLLFVPGLWTALLGGWLAVGFLLRSRPLPLHATALAVTLLAVLWCALSVFWGGAGPHCPAGVPPWWPGPVPAPGF